MLFHPSHELYHSDVFIALFECIECCFFRPGRASLLATLFYQRILQRMLFLYAGVEPVFCGLRVAPAMVQRVKVCCGAHVDVCPVCSVLQPEISRKELNFLPGLSSG